MSVTDTELKARKEIMRPEALEKLESMSINEQKKWVANPLMEWIIASYMNQLLGCKVGGPQPQAVSKPVEAAVVAKDIFHKAKISQMIK